MDRYRRWKKTLVDRSHATVAHDWPQRQTWKEWKHSLRYMYPLGIDHGREGYDSKPPSRPVSRCHHYEPHQCFPKKGARRRRLPPNLVMSPRIAVMLGLDPNKPVSR